METAELFYIFLCFCICYLLSLELLSSPPVANSSWSFRTRSDVTWIRKPELIAPAELASSGVPYDYHHLYCSKSWCICMTPLPPSLDAGTLYLLCLAGTGLTYKMLLVGRIMPSSSQRCPHPNPWKLWLCSFKLAKWTVQNEWVILKWSLSWIIIWVGPVQSQGSL